MTSSTLTLLAALMVGDPTPQYGQLTVTENLIRQEILRLGGDWEAPSRPALVGFLGDQFESRHYEMLTHLPTLPWFAAHDGTIDDYALACLSQVHQLDRLDFVNCEIDTECFSLLRSNRELRIVYLIEVSLPEGSAAEIATLSQVESLRIYDSTFNENIVESLSTMQNLKHLNISGCEGVTQDDVAALREALPNAEVH